MHVREGVAEPLLADEEQVHIVTSPGPHLPVGPHRRMLTWHRGATAQLTADACKRAMGGVLFIDEAYALRNEGSSDSAGQARRARRQSQP